MLLVCFFSWFITKYLSTLPLLDLGTCLSHLQNNAFLLMFFCYANKMSMLSPSTRVGFHRGYCIGHNGLHKQHLYLC